MYLGFVVLVKYNFKMRGDRSGETEIGDQVVLNTVGVVDVENLEQSKNPAAQCG